MRTSRIIDNYIYFYHLDKFCILPLYPETISDSLKSSFTPTDALARTAPIYTYQHSGPRTVHIEFDLHRDMLNDVNKNVSNLKDNVVDFSGDDYVDTLIKYLQAAAMPKYNAYAAGTKSIIPPMVAIRFGSEIFIKGVVTSGINITYKKPILINNKYALVNTNFTVDETDPYDVESVLAEGSFRGITRTFKDGIYESTSSSPTISSSTTSSTNNEALLNVILDKYGKNLPQKKNILY